MNGVFKVGDIVFENWTLVRLIGRGSFGAVYEAERDNFGHKEKSALKIITIPQNDSEIDDLKSDGYDELSITSRFESYLHDIVREYSVMADLKGCVNIVYADNVKYVQHDNGIGWDVFIRMELLTPLTQAIGSRATDEQVIKIASDLCNALVFCEKHKILHRDIKPQNIFVAPDGTYKLGDFGIAKVSEHTTTGTKTGTFKYMAPEVFHLQPYGPGADIYSLGLVLYWLLNDRRTPFLPSPPEMPTASDEEEAKNKRYSGVPVPPPSHGSETLKGIILKACAFDPKDRYQSAEEMLEDIKRIGRRVPVLENDRLYNNALNFKREEEYTAAAKLFEQLGEYRDSKEQAAGCRNLAGLSSVYAEAKAAMANAKTRPEWLAAAKLFESISGWKDADLLKDQCLKEAGKPVRRKIPVILCVAGAAVILIIIAAFFLFTKPGPDSSPASSTAFSDISSDISSDVSSNGSSVAVATPHVHAWGKWTVETDPGCETAGSEVRTCIDDPDHKEWREIPALGHDWAEATTDAPKTCRRCGATEGESLHSLYDTVCQKCSDSNYDIGLPEKSEMLSQSVTRYVKGNNTSSSGGIYLMTKPKGKSIIMLKNHSALTVYALRGDWSDGYALVETEDGRVGWVWAKRLSESNVF